MEVSESAPVYPIIRVFDSQTQGPVELMAFVKSLKVVARRPLCDWRNRDISKEERLATIKLFRHRRIEATHDNQTLKDIGVCLTHNRPVDGALVRSLSPEILLNIQFWGPAYLIGSAQTALRSEERSLLDEPSLPEPQLGYSLLLSGLPDTGPP